MLKREFFQTFTELELADPAKYVQCLLAIQFDDEGIAVRVAGGGDAATFAQQHQIVGQGRDLLRKNLAVGFEYRAMPDKLNKAGAAAGLGDGLRAGDWKDLFIAWAPSKNVSLTLAYVDLGTVVPATTKGKKQTGTYLSAQFAF